MIRWVVFKLFESEGNSEIYCISFLLYFGFRILKAATEHNRGENFVSIYS